MLIGVRDLQILEAEAVLISRKKIGVLIPPYIYFLFFPTSYYLFALYIHDFIVQ